MKTRILSLTVLLGLMTSAGMAQCDCDYTLNTYHPVRNEFTAADIPGYQPGDVICLEAGRWKSTLFTGIKGAPGNPVIIKNCNGQVDITGNYVGIQLSGCQYIKISGTGDASETYGILVDSMPSGTSGINITDLSSDVEVEYVEIANFLAPGGSGIVAKTDPDCMDSLTWRQNFTMRNISIHNNYIHGTGDEGMYIGYTGGYETSKKVCSGVETFGHLIEHVEIYENIIEKTGRDGMQVSLCTLDLEIHDNYITTYGNNGLFDQNFGLSVGSGSRARVYSNTIVQTNDVNATTLNDQNSRGISILNALPPTYIYNNLVINSAGDGIWMHQRLDMTGETEGWYVINNTIINPHRAGIFYNSTIPSTPNDQENWTNGIYNNIIVNPAIDYSNSGFWKTVNEEYVDYNKKNQRDNSNESNNFTTDVIDDLLFLDTTFGVFDFHIDSLSPAKDFGRNVSAFGVNHDFDGRPRTSATDTIYDAGAFEFTKSAPTIGIEDQDPDKDFIVYPNPAAGQVNISVDLDKGGEARVRIMDFRGAKLYEASYRNLVPGNNNLAVNLNNLHFKGAALVVLFTGDKTRTKTVIIQ